MKAYYTSKAGRTACYTVYEQAKKAGVLYSHLVSDDGTLNFWVPCSALKTKEGSPFTAFLNTPLAQPKIPYKTKGNIKLYDHQDAGIQHLLRNPTAYLGDEMGLGKTIQAIVAADNIDCDYVLVVCPASLVKNWEREISQFSLTPSKFYVYSYGKIPESISKQALLICDEAHFIKNWTAQRTRKVAKLALTASKVWLMSGTMLTRSAIDAYVPLSLLAKQSPTKNGYFGFAYQYCEIKKDKFGMKIGGTKNEHLLKTELSRFYLGRKKNEVLDLPEKIRSTMSIKIDMKIAKESAHLYELFEEGKLSVTSGDGAHFATVRKNVGIGKVKKGLEYIEDQFGESEESVVIFAYHKDVVALIQSALPDSRTITGDTSLAEKQKNVEDFQAGKYRYLIGNILACGTGFTLTRASHAVFFEVDVTPSNNLQAEDRIHRIGQTGTCNIHYLCAEKSLDERVFEILKTKEVDIKKVI
jgi:SWI/SNF-related matrix-associated actin-dependent regulator 1 of chromatin subfamily A